jgi:hypothetical protein
LDDSGRSTRKPRSVLRLRPVARIDCFFDPLEKPLLGFGFIAAGEVGIDEGCEHACIADWPDFDRHEPILACCRVLPEARRPFGEGKVRAEVVVGEDGYGALGRLVGALHVLDEVTPEVPVLEPDRVVGFLQHPGNPGRPLTISLVEADEEMALGRRGLAQQGPPHARRSVAA